MSGTYSGFQINKLQSRELGVGLRRERSAERCGQG